MDYIFSRKTRSKLAYVCSTHRFAPQTHFDEFRPVVHLFLTTLHCACQLGVYVCACQLGLYVCACQLGVYVYVKAAAPIRTSRQASSLQYTISSTDPVSTDVIDINLKGGVTAGTKKGDAVVLVSMIEDNDKKVK